MHFWRLFKWHFLSTNQSTDLPPIENTHTKIHFIQSPKSLVGSGLSPAVSCWTPHTYTHMHAHTQKIASYCIAFCKMSVLPWIPHPPPWLVGRLIELLQFITELRQRLRGEKLKWEREMRKKWMEMYKAERTETLTSLQFSLDYCREEEG